MDIFGVVEAEAAKIAKIAPAGYFLALRIRGTSPLIALKTYPQAWIDLYMQNGYMLRDPITTWAMTVGGSIRWSSPLLLDPFRILRQAAKYGLTHGASVAHGPISALSLCSFGRSDREMTDDEIAEVRRIVVGLHEQTALPSRLDEDQKNILSAMAQGVSPTDIAARTGTPEDDMRERFAGLMDALRARTTEEALRRARDYKLI